MRQQMQQGALMMNYSGHGAAYTLSHEQVLHLSDFGAATSQRLPLWLTASCDIMPFDGQEENIGETAMLNKKGGAVAFFGTTRTVYAHYNGYMNRAFTRYVLGRDDNGRRYTIGEAARLAKNLLMTRPRRATTSATTIRPTSCSLRCSATRLSRWPPPPCRWWSTASTESLPLGQPIHAEGRPDGEGMSRPHRNASTRPSTAW